MIKLVALSSQFAPSETRVVFRTAQVSVAQVGSLQLYPYLHHLCTREVRHDFLILYICPKRVSKHDVQLKKDPLQIGAGQMSVGVVSFFLLLLAVTCIVAATKYDRGLLPYTPQRGV